MKNIKKFLDGVRTTIVSIGLLVEVAGIFFAYTVFAMLGWMHDES